MSSIRFSGLARFAAGRRVGASLKAAPLLRNNAIPKSTFGSRLMATAAGNQLQGKIHQVIGAVVDVVCFGKFFFGRNPAIPGDITDVERLSAHHG